MQTERSARDLHAILQACPTFRFGTYLTLFSAPSSNAPLRRVCLQRFLQEVLLAEAAVATNAALLDDAAADADGYRAEPGDAAAELDHERRRHSG